MDTPSMQDIRALILPVGITPDPVIFTIEQIAPEILTPWLQRLVVPPLPTPVARTPV